jgi:hypothetical protein
MRKILFSFLSVQKREARDNGAKGEAGREGERKKKGKAERGRDKYRDRKSTGEEERNAGNGEGGKKEQ